MTVQLKPTTTSARMFNPTRPEASCWSAFKSPNLEVDAQQLSMPCLPEQAVPVLAVSSTGEAKAMATVEAAMRTRENCILVVVEGFLVKNGVDLID